MANDERELELTGATGKDASRYDQIIRDYFDYRLSAFPALKDVCAERPGFAMAHLLKGYLLLSMGTRGTMPAAMAAADHVEANSVELTPREQLHLVALRAWASGDVAGAAVYWDKILFAYPLDLLALKLQHFNLFWLGQPVHMRDAAARVLPAYDENTPGYANLLGMYSFGLEECGSYEKAEQLGREAVERMPDDLWSIHAVAHVYEMQGRLEDGIKWLNQPKTQWNDRNPFKEHIWWHTALFAFDAGDYKRALQLYDEAVWPDVSSFYLDVQNAASMLARLELSGVDVGDRWRSLADTASERMGDHVLLFTEPHYTMAYGRCGEFDKAEAQISSFSEFGHNDTTAAGSRISEVGVPLCEAMRDYYKGDYASAVNRLLPLRYNTQPVGGSHAQRDIFNLFLIDAAERDGNITLAKSLLSERVAQHPNNFDAWTRYSAVCSAAGDDLNKQRAKAEISRISALC